MMIGVRAKSSILFPLLLMIMSACSDEESTTENKDPGIEFVTVTGGTFQMGNNNGDSIEKPEHSVTLSSFSIGKFEVTSAQYCEFLNIAGNQVEGRGTWLETAHNKHRIMIKDSIYTPVSGYEDHPIVYVTWYGARAFCEYYGYRLPTEVEWEYAARGGNKSEGYTYSGSNDLRDVGWHAFNSGSTTHSVGELNSNELGIYDMSGNVYEWVSDWYSYNYYSHSPGTNPQGPDSSSVRVIRGGAWDWYLNECRCTHRSRRTPYNASAWEGFRCAADIE